MRVPADVWPKQHCRVLQSLNWMLQADKVCRAGVLCEWVGLCQTLGNNHAQSCKRWSGSMDNFGCGQS